MVAIGSYEALDLFDRALAQLMHRAPNARGRCAVSRARVGDHAVQTRSDKMFYPDEVGCNVSGVTG